MEIKTNNRLDPKDGEGIRFGVVVTLKEINGINRIDEFIKIARLTVGLSIRWISRQELIFMKGQ